MKKQSPLGAPMDGATAVEPLRVSNAVFLGLASGAFLLTLALYLLRLDRVVGMYGDDAWYVLLAKALATGQGYTLINSPSGQITPFYPPGFSFLLSLFWRLYPQFPQNLWLLKAVSIAAMLGVGIAAYSYFVREMEQPRLIALGLAFVIVSSPAFVFLATSTVLSECVFTLVLLLAILAGERCVRAAQNKELTAQVWRWVALSAGLAGFAFLLRSIALGLIAATFLYLLKQRLPKLAAVYVAGVLLLVGPWMVYSRLHAPTAAQQAEQNSYIVQSYAQQFWQRKASYAPEGSITLDELPTRVWENAYHLLEYDFGALILYPMYRAIEPSEGRLRYWWHDYSSLALSALIILGFGLSLRRRLGLAELMIVFSLAITVLWPFRPFRYVLPLLPWAWYYLLVTLRSVPGWLGGSGKKTPAPQHWQLPALALGVLIAVNLWSNTSYILTLHGTPAARPRWVQYFAENEKLMDWLKTNVLSEAITAGQNPALVYLYTGIKGVGSTEPGLNWERWRQLKVRYFIQTSFQPLPEPPPVEKQFRRAYFSPTSNMRVVDLGDPAMRPAWK